MNDIIASFPDWSDRNLRWLIAYLAQRYEQSGQGYTVMLQSARAECDNRTVTERTVADTYEDAGHFILSGIEGHEFGRCSSEQDCFDLASRMGLGIVQDGYFGHATIQEIG